MPFLSRWLARSPAPLAVKTQQHAGDLFDPEFLSRLESLALASRRAAAGVRMGERRSKKRGSGVEFADHKSYTPGDDIRLLDVGVYQRLGKLLLRVYEEEEDLSVYFLVDTSASMARGDKHKQAARLTAALGYIALSSLDRVGVVALTDTALARLAPIRGKQRLFRLLRFLSGLRPQGKTHLDLGVRAFIAERPRRGLAILITDTYDPRGVESAVSALLYSRFEVGVLGIGSQGDTEVPSGDLELSDVETNERLELTMTSALTRAIRSRLETRREDVRRFCAKKHVPYFFVDAQAPFDEVVLSLLRQGGLLR